ncbi:hypothetical protein M404DRAFT_32182 [Pisolithus tinctorius Marx 270]|uniref:Uncharacterized protein n=1 Tax=Pisolithus tinctorius Marx 270 TaxID=870435 RepID=A0A0C3N912_PISTI|nr:hypothetical protein M404DRAFT_32182 [Pisolithus tinctorius Marx 270]
MSRLREEVIGSPRTLPHVLIPLQIACEVDHILLVIAAAYCECIIVEEMQDANAIADRSTYTEINHPAAVIDKEGNILLWYLLDVFGQAYQVAEIWNLLGSLSIPLVRSMKSNGAGSWWHDSNHFHKATDLKGAIDLSPAWFQQGCGVSHYPFEDDFTPVTLPTAQQPFTSPGSITTVKRKVSTKGDLSMAR